MKKVFAISVSFNQKNSWKAEGTVDTPENSDTLLLNTLWAQLQVTFANVFLQTQ